MIRAEGRYRSPRTAEWSGWMPLQPGLSHHNWGGQQFEFRYVEDPEDHNWTPIETVRSDGRLRVTIVWCPNCDATRQTPAFAWEEERQKHGG